LTKLNVLVAYPYAKRRTFEQMERLGDDVRWLLDSGAFTAFKSGKPIVFDEYCRFIETAPVKPWRYFTLDVIGDPAATATNYQAMLDRGLQPIPIFTRGNSLDDLDALFRTAEIVGIGGLVVANNRPHRYLRRLMQHVEGRKVHLLGFTEPHWLHFFRPFMCDSSNISRGQRFGLIDVYLGSGRFARLYRDKVAETRPEPHVMDAIRLVGLDPHALQRWEHWTKSNGVARWLAVSSWVRYSLDIEKALGVKLFLGAAEHDLPCLTAAYRAATGKVRLEDERQRIIADRRAA
jgi:hypothetical protein